MRINLPSDWQMPALFGNRLGDTAGRQRAMSAEGHLLLVLHEPPVVGVPERTGRLFWRDPEGTWKSKPLGDGVQALKRHIAEFADRVDVFEQQWQSADTAQAYYLLLQALAPVHRTVCNLHTTLQQAREMAPDDRDLINLRDQVGELERTIELLHGDAKNGLNFTVAHQVEQQAERSHEMALAAHRLNLLAATFLPIATISGVYGAIFGMILAHGEQGWSTPTLFWVALVISLVCGVVLTRMMARKPAPPTKPTVKVKVKKR